MSRTGRPKGSAFRCAENAAIICDRLWEGHSLRAIAKDMGCSEGAIRLWEKEDPDFAAQYAKARDAWAHAKAEEIIDLADEAREQPPEMTNAYRLAVDTRKWVTSKLLPKKYGDKLTIPEGEDGKPAIPVFIMRLPGEN